MENEQKIINHNLSSIKIDLEEIKKKNGRNTVMSSNNESPHVYPNLRETHGENYRLPYTNKSPLYVGIKGNEGNRNQPYKTKLLICIDSNKVSKSTKTLDVEGYYMEMVPVYG